MTETSEISGPPRLIQTMVAGFDAITNHVWLILFPFGLDLLIWFAPRLRITSLMRAFLSEVAALPMDETPELAAMLETGQQAWMQFAEQVNLMSALRSYPVGIPGLLPAAPPVETPLGTPKILELPTTESAVLVFGLLTFAGFLGGTLYFLAVSQAALQDEIRWCQVFAAWPRASVQVILLALVWLGIFIAVTLPSSCVISLAAVGGVSPGMCVSMLYGGALLWIAFQLMFSAHGIFVEQLNVLSSLRAGMRVVNLTLPGAALFVVAALVLSQGLDLLWRIPPADSWLTLLGLAGHAFVATGLVASSFIYYHDTRQWIAQLTEQSRPDAIG